MKSDRGKERETKIKLRDRSCLLPRIQSESRLNTTWNCIRDFIFSVFFFFTQSFAIFNLHHRLRCIWPTWTYVCIYANGVNWIYKRSDAYYMSMHIVQNTHKFKLRTPKIIPNHDVSHMKGDRKKLWFWCSFTVVQEIASFKETRKIIQKYNELCQPKQNRTATKIKNKQSSWNSENELETEKECTQSPIYRSTYRYRKWS